MFVALLPAVAGGQAANCQREVAQCQLLAPSASFGRLITSGSEPESVATFSLTVTCTRLNDRTETPPPPARIDIGVSALPALDARSAQGPGGRASYGLYLDAALTRPWGDGSVNTGSIQDTLVLQGAQTTVTRTYWLYGRIHGQQLLQPGLYVDAVTLAMTYTVDCSASAP
jgi:spore coat protein U-like protein